MVKKEHWVIIDLEKSYQIYRFRIFDCGHKENYSDNFKNFKIWVSNDAETWTEPVVDEKGRPENTKDDYIAPIVGRYVMRMPLSQYVYGNSKYSVLKVVRSSLYRQIRQWISIPLKI